MDYCYVLQSPQPLQFCRRDRDRDREVRAVSSSILTRTEALCFVLSTGDYHELGVRFYFARRVGYYLIRVYIPAALIVFLSWLSFFVDKNSAPARVSLGITTVLTMTTLLIGIGQGSLPVVSYVKAVDWYLIVCFILVFGAFAEFALLSHKNCTKLPGMIHKRREHIMVSSCYIVKAKTMVKYYQ